MSGGHEIHVPPYGNQATKLLFFVKFMIFMISHELLNIIVFHEIHDFLSRTHGITYWPGNFPLGLAKDGAMMQEMRAPNRRSFKSLFGV